MRIVIDMQGLQASNSKRGIGRYILNFVKEFIRQNEDNEIILLCNGMLHDSFIFIKNEFGGYQDLVSIRLWNAVPEVSRLHSENAARVTAAEKIREDYIARLEPDVILLTSLFEGLVDNAVTSINLYERPITTVVILYDLIPYIYQDLYLASPVVKDWYLKKISNLKRADYVLSISESSGKEIVDYLNYDAQNVYNISTAASLFFQKKNYSDSEINEWKNKFGIKNKIILYTGGIDIRKNIERLIEAYSLLSHEQRSEYQLAIVCSITETDQVRLSEVCRKFNLAKDEVIFTGYISEDDLLVFYNQCDFLVFPSWHEGFGLPILEAMQCGKAVIGGKYSSIPEVIGNEKALFDPYDVYSISQSMSELISDRQLHAELECHSIQQATKFSWKQTAKKAWEAILNNHSLRNVSAIEHLKPKHQMKKMAYFSPLPPAKSGIAHYSAELIRELSAFYHIDLICLPGENTDDPYLIANCEIKSIDWFKDNAQNYDRIIYHFGNSHFHWHMFELLQDYPGVVVLHDYFLSGIVAHIDVNMQHRVNGWSRELYKSGNWEAIKMRYQAKDTADVVYKYPCNLSVLQNSLGIISHSEYSKNLAIKEYGYGNIPEWETIPLLRMPAWEFDKVASRKHLQLEEDALVVCSFGMMGPTKLNKELIMAWLASALSQDKKCYLIFAGEKANGQYGEIIGDLIGKNNPNIKITGWLNNADYAHWLAAADIGVQLRTCSRGESSAAVLDCMNYGLATVVNANGSMAELDDNSVLKLPDEFTINELSDALNRLYTDAQFRSNLSGAAFRDLRHNYHPRNCAQKYVSAIEKIYSKPQSQPHNLVRMIAKDFDGNESDLARICQSISQNFIPVPRKKNLFVDVSELIQRDAKSGIQRVVREVISHLLNEPIEGYAIELVYATTESHGFNYARKFGARILQIPDDWADDSPIDYFPGDVFLGLDLQPAIVNSQFQYLKEMQRNGVFINYVVYDLLPINHADFFFPGAKETYTEWFSKISTFDGLTCISNTVATELKTWLKENKNENHSCIPVNYFHLGANPTIAVTENNEVSEFEKVLANFKNKNTFLVVSTIEPRKQHAAVLEAFEKLWNENVDANLVFVGKEGWMVEDLINKMKVHPELNKRFFWFSGISDNQLNLVYKASDCLICASAGEGFGLPIIEAAQHSLPVIARDIPVFREVGKDYVYYFSGDASAIAKAIKEWISLKNNNKIPEIEDLGWLTWSQSTEQLISAVLENVSTNKL